MKTRTMMLIAVAANLIAVAGATGQTLADRIARTEGDVRLTFRARPGVCGDGGPTIYVQDKGERRVMHYRGDGNSYTSRNDRYAKEWQPECEVGPVRVAVTIDGGHTLSVRTYVGGNWRPGGSATDLGQVSARDAANALLTLAERASSRGGSDAVFAATLADSTNLGPQLLRMARNRDLSNDTRKNVIFWLGQAVAEYATAGLEEIIRSDDDVELRKHAIFALSQRPKDEAVPALISVVRKGTDPRLTKTALFWLGQTNDPRALDLFEELLLRK